AAGGGRRRGRELLRASAVLSLCVGFAFAEAAVPGPIAGAIANFTVTLIDAAAFDGNVLDIDADSGGFLGEDILVEIGRRRAQDSDGHLHRADEEQGHAHGQREFDDPQRQLERRCDRCTGERRVDEGPREVGDETGVDQGGHTGEDHEELLGSALEQCRHDVDGHMLVVTQGDDGSEERREDDQIDRRFLRPEKDVSGDVAQEHSEDCQGGCGDESAAGEEVLDPCEVSVDSAHRHPLSLLRSRSSSTTSGPMTSRYLSYSEGTTMSLKACRCFLLGSTTSVLPDSSMVCLASALTF